MIKVKIQDSRGNWYNVNYERRMEYRGGKEIVVHEIQHNGIRMEDSDLCRLVFAVQEILNHRRIKKNG